MKQHTGPILCWVFLHWEYCLDGPAWLGPIFIWEGTKTGWPTKPAENRDTPLGYRLSLLNSQYDIIRYTDLINMIF